MGRWELKYSDASLKDLEKIDRPVRREIIDRLEWLATHFDEITPSPLHAEWKGFFKFRVSGWRVVYDFESAHGVVKIHQIDRRDKVYKRR